jgi:hypothetical protein
MKNKLQYQLEYYNSKHEKEYDEKFFVDKSDFYEDVINQLLDKVFHSNNPIDPDNITIVILGGIDERSKYINLRKVD